MKTWDELSMAEKSEMIGVAVRNGITDLATIRQKYNEFAEGGSIHIDPAKKGTFTAAATKHGMGIQEFASKVLAHPENYSPAMRKKANFAKNASKFKHSFGGPLVEAAMGHQYGLGDYLRKGVDWFGNALQIGAIAENPSIMTAAGWRVNNDRAVQDRQSAPETQQLRENLVAIGDAALTAPTLVADLEALYQGGKQVVLHPVQSARAAKEAVVEGARAAREGLRKGVDTVRRRIRRAPSDEWSEAATPQITPENAASITPEQWDAAYNAALKAVDKAEIQRLRDLHFKAKAPNTKITDFEGNPTHIYHGTPYDWTSVDPSKFGTYTDEGYYGRGLYGTERKLLAKGYGDNILDLYVNSERPFTAGTQDIYGNPYGLDEAIDRSSAVYYFNRGKRPDVFHKADKNTNVENLFREIKNADAAVYGIPKQRFNEVVVPDGRQVKLANPITYDDNGNVIPLSQRDNFNINEIRYGLLPLIGGIGTVPVLSNKKPKSVKH